MSRLFFFSRALELPWELTDIIGHRIRVRGTSYSVHLYEDKYEDMIPEDNERVPKDYVTDKNLY